jgi:hypothetical protein
MIDGEQVVCPQNDLDRAILELLLVHEHPAGHDGYWDVISSQNDPMGADDLNGRVFVSWDDASKARQLDPFSLVRENGFRVKRMSE